MKYRGIEYTVVQGIARQVWKWSVSVAGMVITGRAKTRSDAVQMPSARLTGRLLLKSGDLLRQTSRAANISAKRSTRRKTRPSTSSNARLAVLGSIAAISGWYSTTRGGYRILIARSSRSSGPACALTFW
jgi:hypothetical protein